MTDDKRPPRRPSDRPSVPARGRPTASLSGPPETRDDARVAKIMARAGLCSRRDAEGWIAAGRVAVNGAIIDSPALNVGAGDRITIDGVPLPERPPTRLYLFHKPRGVVTTSRDPEGRPTIFDVMPKELPRLVTVGRLDINTEGLLLLTNDGGLARTLELPSTGWVRRYRVRANGEVTQPQLDALAKGIAIDGVTYAGIEARLDRVQGANLWLTMGLTEGKNREIKRVLEHLGLAVTRLIRLSFGPFQLGDLPPEAVEPVPTRVLKDQLGDAAVLRSGLDLPTGHEPRPARHRATEPKPAGSAHETRLKSETRAHVTALRSRKDAAGEGRRRTERGATADRKGRAVAVERVSSAVPREDRGDSRNARRFAREQQGEGRERRPYDPVAAAKRERPGSGEVRVGRPARRPAAGAAGAGDGPPRGRRPRPGQAADRPSRPARSAVSDRSGPDAGPSRGPRDEHRDRPTRHRERSFAGRGAPGRETPAERDRSAKPARGSRGEAAKPRGPKPGGGRPKPPGQSPSPGRGGRPRG